MYGKDVVMVTLATGIMFLILICMHFWVWGILRRWSVCAPTAYGVVRDCRRFEKHCSNGTTSKLNFMKTRSAVLDMF
jgi:hypothetical protein